MPSALILAASGLGCLAVGIVVVARFRLRLSELPLPDKKGTQTLGFWSARDRALLKTASKPL
jgi:hypothetical protein